MIKTELCEIMNRNRSDKGSGHHNYTVEYTRLFQNIRNTAENIFEVGLGTNNIDVPSTMGKDARPGASLYGWKEYFLNANIFGADIDKRILFQEDRIKTFFVDQTDSKTINDMWNDDQLKNVKFDVIIDDGLHEMEANINFFKNSYHKLKSNGIYVIEDIVINKLNNYTQVLNYLMKSNSKINFNYDVKILGNPYNNHDNCLIVIYLG